MSRFPRFLLLLLILWAGQASADGRSLRFILESAGARFIFNHTSVGRALAEEVIGARVSTLDSHWRLVDTLGAAGRDAEARAIVERLRRIEGRLSEDFPLEGAAWFRGTLTGDRARIIARASELAETEFRGGVRSLLPAVAETREAFLTGDAALTGIGRLEPESTMFRFFRERIRALTSWPAFPAIQARRLGRLTRIQGAGGLGNAGVFRATLDGRAVAVKVSDPAARTEREVMNEARMMMILNRLGLGAEFRGVVELPEGAYGLVFEYVEGIAFPLRRSATIPAGFLQRSHAREILRAGNLIDRAGIRYAPDLQFILTSDGRAVLVDPEYFLFEVPVSPALDLPYHPVENARELARAIVRRIEGARGL